jgi:hypothetical protein
MPSHVQVSAVSDWYRVGWTEKGVKKSQDFRSRIEAEQEFKRHRNAGRDAVCAPFSALVRR